MAEQSSSAGEHRFFLDLFIVHPTLVPDEITKILGMEPDVTHCIGAARRTPKGTPLSGTYANTRWRRSAEHVVEDPGFAPELSRLIDTLGPHKAFFRMSKPAAEQQASLFNSWTAFSPTNCPAQRLLDLSISICHSESSATRVFRSRGRLLLDDCFGSFSTHLAEIEDWLMSAPVRKRRAKSGPGALRLAGLP